MDPSDLLAGAVVAALPCAACLIGSDDVVLAWNGKAEALFGLSARDAVGRAFRDLDVSFRVRGLRAAVERVKGGAPGESLTEDGPARTPDGPYALSVTPVGDGA